MSFPINTIHQGDCLELMKQIPNNSVDLILCDLPYGTTKCSWDSIIPFEPLWEQYRRICKSKAAIVLTASQPFTSALVMSNIKDFKYCWVWEKSNPSNIALANRMPLKYHEDVCVFYREQPTYNKQMIERDELGKKRILAGQKTGVTFKMGITEHQPGNVSKEYSPDRYNASLKNPSSVLKIRIERNKTHPTQKPVSLMEYLIKTYSNLGELVLDNCAGSGTTGVAARNTGRNFILIEKEPEYVEVCKKRLELT
jgi:site-specific DNA-methyltransferase (adenine-specific)